MNCHEMYVFWNVIELKLNHSIMVISLVKSWHDFTRLLTATRQLVFYLACMPIWEHCPCLFTFGYVAYSSQNTSTCTRVYYNHSGPGPSVAVTCDMATAAAAMLKIVRLGRTVLKVLMQPRCQCMYC